MNVHFQSRAQKPPLESSQCSLWASECGAEEAIWLYYFTYSFTATRGVLVSCGALAISSNENSRSGQSSSFAGLLPWAVLKPCLSAPTGCGAREVQKRPGGNQLRLEQADRAAAPGMVPKVAKWKGDVSPRRGCPVCSMCPSWDGLNQVGIRGVTEFKDYWGTQDGKKTPQYCLFCLLAQQPEMFGEGWRPPSYDPSVIPAFGFDSQTTSRC